MQIDRLKNMISKEDSVKHNIVKTMTQTIFDTMTNANSLF